MESGDAVLKGVLNEVLLEKREFLDACENLRSEDRRKKIRIEALKEKIERLQMEFNDLNCRELEVNMADDHLATDAAENVDFQLKRKKELLLKRKALVNQVAELSSEKLDMQHAARISEPTSVATTTNSKQSNEAAEQKATLEALAIRKKRLENVRKSEGLKQRCAFLQSALQGDLHWDHSSTLSSRQAALKRTLLQKQQARDVLLEEMAKQTPANVTL